VLGYVELTDKSYFDTLRSHKYILLEIYEPWCTYCYEQQLDAITQALKTIIPGHEVLTARIDVSKNLVVGKMFKNKQFPHLRWFVDGLYVKEYNAGADPNDMAKWVKKQVEPIVYNI
jgi:thioredoxin-like negative regulator of GroEL